MTRSIYILGGPGSGKSTFMSSLMYHLNVDEYCPLEDLHGVKNAAGNPVVLRGHLIICEDGREGLYLGKIRDKFPGTDGLDRASSLPGAEWLGTAQLPDFIIAEGATLTTERFLTALSETTDMLLVYLWADPFVIELRCLQRGSSQNPGWMKGRVTAARSLHEQFGGLNVDTADPAAVTLALTACLDHLKGAE